MTMVIIGPAFFLDASTINGARQLVARQRELASCLARRDALPGDKFGGFSTSRASSCWQVPSQPCLAFRVY